MLSFAIRSFTRQHVHTPAIFRHHKLQQLTRRHVSTPPTTETRIQAIKRKVSNPVFINGFIVASYLYVPLCLKLLLESAYKDLQLTNHMDMRTLMKEELRNVRVIFEDQEQWAVEESKGRGLRAVGRDGKEVEYNFVKVRVSDAVMALSRQGLGS